MKLLTVALLGLCAIALAGDTAPKNSDTGAADAAMPFPQLCEKAMNDLQTKTAAHASLWGLGDAERWSLDQDQGNLVFTFPDKVVTCKAQIIGSWDQKLGTWMWAWANESVEKQLAVQSRKIRAYGVEHKIAKLTKAEWAATEDEAWKIAALACLIGDAQGVYRGPAGDISVFIAFGAPKIQKK